MERAGSQSAWAAQEPEAGAAAPHPQLTCWEAAARELRVRTPLLPVTNLKSRPLMSSLRASVCYSYIDTDVKPTTEVPQAPTQGAKGMLGRPPAQQASPRIFMCLQLLFRSPVRSTPTISSSWLLLCVTTLWHSCPVFEKFKGQDHIDGALIIHQTERPMGQVIHYISYEMCNNPLK